MRMPGLGELTEDDDLGWFVSAPAIWPILPVGFMGMARWWDGDAVRGSKAADRAVVLIPAVLFAAAMVALFQRWEVVFWVCAGGTVLGQYATLQRRP